MKKLIIPTIQDNEFILHVGKNSRKPKRANHGARPCSSYMRRLKRRSLYGRFKEDKGIEDYSDFDMTHLHHEVNRAQKEFEQGGSETE